MKYKPFIFKRIIIDLFLNKPHFQMKPISTISSQPCILIFAETLQQYWNCN